MNMSEIKQLETKAEFLRQNQREGEVYVGLVLGKNGAPDYHLFLLPSQGADINWADAKKWAAKAGGELPTRQEGALLFANLAEQFEKRYYWTSEQHSDGSDYAWMQGFISGFQFYVLKSTEYRCRAVRRLVIS